VKKDSNWSKVTVSSASILASNATNSGTVSNVLHRSSSVLHTSILAMNQPYPDVQHTQKKTTKYVRNAKHRFCWIRHQTPATSNVIQLVWLATKKLQIQTNVWTALNNSIWILRANVYNVKSTDANNAKHQTTAQNVLFCIHYQRANASLVTSKTASNVQTITSALHVKQSKFVSTIWHPNLTKLKLWAYTQVRTETNAWNAKLITVNHAHRINTVGFAWMDSNFSKANALTVPLWTVRSVLTITTVHHVPLVMI
jgi:hypothetical protein